MKEREQDFPNTEYLISFSDITRNCNWFAACQTSKQVEERLTDYRSHLAYICQLIFQLQTALKEFVCCEEHTTSHLLSRHMPAPHAYSQLEKKWKKSKHKQFYMSVSHRSQNKYWLMKYCTMQVTKKNSRKLNFKWPKWKQGLGSISVLVLQDPSLQVKPSRTKQSEEWGNIHNIVISNIHSMKSVLGPHFYYLGEIVI